jgi:Flp pilus assembly pilin Flp
MKATSQLIRDESGIQHAEEALLLVGIAVALVTAAKSFSNGLVGAFNGSAAIVAASI